MSQQMLLAMLSGANAPPQTYVDDLFVSYLRSGTGSSATITTGFQPDLVWTKARSTTTGHYLTDSARGVTKSLNTNGTGAQATDANGLTAFNSTGYTIGSDTNYNNSTGPVTYVDWAWKKAAKFFDVVTYTGNGTNTAINHSLGQTPGLIIVKCTSTAHAWKVWHRSLTSSAYYLQLNSTTAQTSDATVWNSTDPTSTQFTVGTDGDVNANGATYVAYLFAHDTATNGIIQCGTWDATSSTRLVTTLGWEPQFLLYKRVDGVEDWMIVDNMRGFLANNGTGASSSKNLRPNTSGAETTQAQVDIQSAIGFASNLNYGGSGKMIYLAIRRPNKPPTSGTQVYNAIARTGTGATATVTGAGFPVDLLIAKDRDSTGQWAWNDRLRGATKELTSQATDAETTFANDLTGFDTMDGCKLGSGASGQMNTNATNYIFECFKRAPGVFDVVCYQGSGANASINHNLGVAPEMMVIKGRDYVREWAVYHSGIANTEFMVLNATTAKQTDTSKWNSTTQNSSSVFYIGTDSDVNNASHVYVAYLFATLAGISKVGSYTGNGSSLTINCGFSAGARFVLIKCTDSTGNWNLLDSVRGIVAGNDSVVRLNLGNAEATTADCLDTDNSGFIVNQDASFNLNVNLSTYIYLAFA